MPAPQSSELPLRAIHEGPAITWWPPAIGWWILALLLVVVLILGVRFFYKKWQHNRWRRSAFERLDAVAADYRANQNSVQLLTQLAQLLRRCLLAHPTSKAAAGLSGELWLQYLDQDDKEAAFSQGLGRLLITCPYQKSTALNDDEINKVGSLIPLVKNWIKRQT